MGRKWGFLFLGILLSGAMSAHVTLADPPPLKKHTIIIYTSEKNNLEPAAFKDFNKLTAFDSDDSIAVHQLMETKSFGSYRFRIAEGARGPIIMQPVSDPGMSNPDVLKELIRSAIMEDPAEHYSLILQGHGWSFILRTEEDSYMTVSKVRKVLEDLNIKMDLISLDMCLMSTIETIYELRSVTQYLIANEDYCPWDGIISPQFLTSYAKGTNMLEIVSNVARASFEQNKNISDPADLTLIDTKKVEELGKLVQSFHLKPAEYMDEDLIDPNEKNYEYDLFELIMANRRISSEDKERFRNLFNECVIYYDRNSAKIATHRTTHGISILEGLFYAAMTDSQKADERALEYYSQDPPLTPKPISR